MSDKATKKVRQTTVEEYEAPIKEESKVIDLQPIDYYPLHQEFSVTDQEDVTLQRTFEPELKTIVNERERALQFLEKLPEGAQATIFIQRLADTINQKNAFIVPCQTAQKLQSYTWYGQNSSESDLHNSITDTYGGGNYKFEVRYGQGMTGLFWKDTLADSPEWTRLHNEQEREIRQDLEQSELERIKAELEKLKLEKQTQNVNQSNSNENVSLLVKLAEIEGNNRISLLELEHKMELEKLRNQSNKSDTANDALSLLQQGAKTNNTLLIETANKLLFEENKSPSWTELIMDVLSSPEKVEQAQSMFFGGLSVISNLIKPQNAQPTQPTQPEKPKSAVEKYKERKQQKQAESEPETKDVKND